MIKFFEPQENIQQTQLTQILFIGKIGTGKSSTIKSLVECPNLHEVFKSSSSPKSCTKETIYKKCHWKNSQDFVMAIDTAGLQEGADKDKGHINEMVLRLINIDYVNAIFIVVSGSESRIDYPTIQMLKTFQSTFGSSFIKHVAFIFTKWEQSKKAITTRRKRNDTEEEKRSNFIKMLREQQILMDEDLDEDVGFFFIDNQFNEYELDEIEDAFEAVEIEEHAYTLQQIRYFTEQKSPFSTQGLLAQAIEANKSLQEQVIYLQNELEKERSQLKQQRTLAHWLNDKLFFWKSKTEKLEQDLNKKCQQLQNVPRNNKKCTIF